MRSGGSERPSNSILRRLMLISFFVAAVTIGTFAFVMIQYQKRSIHKELESNASLLAASIDRSVTSPAARAEFTPVVDHCMRVMKQQPGIVYAVVTRKEDGYSVIHTKSGWKTATLSGKWNPDSEISTEAGELDMDPFNQEMALHFTKTSSGIGPNWGWIHVGLSLQDYYRSIRGVYGITGIVAGVTKRSATPSIDTTSTRSVFTGASLS